MTFGADCKKITKNLDEDDIPDNLHGEDRIVAEEELYKRRLKTSHGVSHDEVTDRIDDIKAKEKEEYERSLKRWDKKQEKMKNG
ncbi:unnamed protein product [marine sediment metagenome]|uniref:Uncharacterized protein n=1 Tax=marine sediment metagenome TaxID=412755 RepID=X1LYS6_9ZZZZ